MRRILKATTAIVTSISLILPQIAVAQGQDGSNVEQLLLQKKKREEQQHQQKQQPKKEAPPRQEPAREPQKQQPKPQAAKPQAPKPQEPKAQQQEPRQQPKPQAREAAPAQREKPRPAPEQPVRQQRAEPAQQQAKPQPQKPVPPKPQQRQDNAQKPAEDAQPARKPQPAPQGNPPAAPRAQQDRQGDQRDAGRGAAIRDVDQPDAKPAAPQKRNPPPDAAELKREMQQRERPDAPRPDENAPPRAQNGQRPQSQDQAQGQVPGKPQPGQPQPGQPQPGQPQMGQNGANQPAPERLTADQLKQALQRGKGEARLPAPEARARDNDVARRAAAAAAVGAPAAALSASDAQGKLVERVIDKNDLRRSDQDFSPIRDRDARPGPDNQGPDGSGPRQAELDRQMRDLRQERARLEQARRNNDRDAEWRALERRERELAEQQRDLDRRERDLDRREARRDDDDHGSDIGKLLLAGAAGFAVGKLLSGNRQVALNTGDRAVLTLPDGSQQIVRDDNALLYQPGSNVQTETFADGSTRTTVLRADGSRVVTIRDADMNILRRTLVRPDGRETRLIDDTRVQPVQVSTLPPPQPVQYTDRPWNETDLRNALLSESTTDRRFTLTQIRDIPEVRSLVAPVNVPEITFDSGSAALSSDQAEQLATLGKVIRDAIDQNPNEMFMIEGYTDATGSPAANLALSDRRAESVALALTEYFQVPPENMVVQGYGEQFMLVPSDGAERENRRVAVRRITDLLEQNG